MCHFNIKLKIFEGYFDIFQYIFFNDRILRNVLQISWKYVCKLQKKSK